MSDFGDGRLPERFWAKVVVTPASCWEWTGSRAPNGYGRVSWQDRLRPAHRLAYEALVGAVPTGLELDHLCRNRPCCNPAHLEPVTRRENVLRGESLQARNAAKTHCANGHPLSGGNLKIERDGGRRCLTCRRVGCRRRWRQRQGASLLTWGEP